MTVRWLMAAGGSGVVLNFSGITVNPNILALAQAQGWLGYGSVTINVLPGADVGALVIPNDFPDGSVYIVNNGRIGGLGGSRNSRGGTGIYTRRKITITNNGTIFGGGGGGGDGEGYQLCYSSQCHSASGGSGGVGGGYYVTGYRENGLPGDSGENSNRPPSGIVGDVGSTINAGSGGSGGSIGQPGNIGSFATISGSYNSSTSTPRTSPGPAGYYVDGNSFVTWRVAGTRIGNVI